MVKLKSLFHQSAQYCFQCFVVNDDDSNDVDDDEDEK